MSSVGASYLHLNNSMSNLLRSQVNASAGPLGPRQMSFSHVPLNQDPNPVVVRKKPPPVTYNQNISVRFIKPSPLPDHGDIIIKQMPDVQAPSLPPLHLRQQPPQPAHPPTRIIREQPPVPPPRLPTEVLTIPGRVIRQPQQVIREDFAPMPPKPPAIIIERWLPYPEQVREVVYEPAPPPIHLNNGLPQGPPQVIHQQFPNLAYGTASPLLAPPLSGIHLGNALSSPLNLQHLAGFQAQMPLPFNLSNASFNNASFNSFLA